MADYAVNYFSGKNSKRNNKFIAVELNKLYDRVKNSTVEEFFTMEFKGYKFNVLPFLLCGSSYLDNEYRGALYATVRDTERIVEGVGLDELYKCSYLDFEMFFNILPSSQDFATRLIGAWVAHNNWRDMAYLLLHGYIDVMFESVGRGIFNNYDFKYKDICNTQAFSVYIGVAWLFYQSPELKRLLANGILKTGFYKKLSSFCPEESIHFKWIKGEIDSKQLHELYTKKSFSDGSSIIVREVVSNAAVGEYTGSDLSNLVIGMAQEFIDANLQCKSYILNQGLASCLLSTGTYKALYKRIDDIQYQYNESEKEVKKLKTRLSNSRGSISELKQEVKDKEKEIVDLRIELRNRPIHDDLVQQLDACKNQIKELQSENEALFEERLSLKQLISKQKKELKRGSSSPEVVDEVTTTLEDNVEDKSSYDFKTAVEYLKDMNICVVGGFEIAIDKKLQEIGFNHVNLFTKSSRSLGSTSLVLVLIDLVHHSEVYKVENMARGSNISFVYYKGTNIEKMVKSMYEEVVE